jgi:hypothetical protein
LQGPETVLVLTVNPSPNAPIVTSIPIVQGQVGVAPLRRRPASRSRRRLHRPGSASTP